MKRKNCLPALLSSVAIFLMSLLNVFAVEIKGDAKGVDVAKKVFDRPDGSALKRKLQIELIDAKGEKRERSAMVLRARNEREKKTIIMYDAPLSIKGTAFLSKDKLDGSEIRDQFLYLPALKRERRIPSSERGDYFLGTDFTYEDVKNELKFDPKDYEFSFKGDGGPLLGAQKTVVIEGRSRSEKISKELGYSHFIATVDPSNSMVLVAEFFDVKSQKLKTVTVQEIEKIQGIFTAKKIDVKNHQTGHGTRFIYSDVQYSESMDSRLFEFDSIAKGPKTYQ